VSERGAQAREGWEVGEDEDGKTTRSLTENGGGERSRVFFLRRGRQQQLFATRALACEHNERF
jgi:hypothetical protein